MFTVHIEKEGRRTLAVYALREWSQGRDNTRHKLARFSDPCRAEVYALALAEVLGADATIYH
jgi:predicted transporter